MPEPDRHDEAEGWRVPGWGGVGLAVAIYLLAAIGIGGAAALFAFQGPGQMRPPAPRRFPAPQLNVRLDRDPRWSYAPRSSGPPGVEAAMKALAAEGDAGWETGGEAPHETGAPRR